MRIALHFYTAAATWKPENASPKPLHTLHGFAACGWASFSAGAAPSHRTRRKMSNITGILFLSFFLSNMIKD